MNDDRKMWLVRCEGGKLYEVFREQGLVALGGEVIQPDLTGILTRSDLDSVLAKSGVRSSPQALGYLRCVLSKFVLDMSVGDYVVTYKTSLKKFLVGKVVGSYEYSVERIQSKQHFRSVEWSGTVMRGSLQEEPNQLKTPHSIMQLPDFTKAEFLNRVQ